MKTLTVLEYAQKIEVAPVTVYRRIDRGEIQAIVEDGIKKVVVPDDFESNSREVLNRHTGRSEIQCNSPEIQSETHDKHLVFQVEYIDELKRQIERLEAQNSELLRELQASREREYQARQRADQTIQQMEQNSAEAQQRSDTIILSLTRQFEEQTKLREDMHHRSLWSRVKATFGFACAD